MKSYNDVIQGLYGSKPGSASQPSLVFWGPVMQAWRAQHCWGDHKRQCGN